MSDETVLADLDAEAAPQVRRFDHGDALDGRMAVLPSAFNPPTIAHLELLAAACRGDDSARPAALLSTKNVAKGIFGAGLADRVGMLLAMRTEAPDLAVLATNAARLVDQARALRAAFPGATFDFVVGYDTLIRLFDAVYYEDMSADLAEFFAHHRVVATNRGEFAVTEVAAFIANVACEYAGRIVVREIAESPANVSSTAARSAVAQGQRTLTVTQSVATYIEQHGLYRET